MVMGVVRHWVFTTHNIRGSNTFQKGIKYFLKKSKSLEGTPVPSFSPLNKNELGSYRNMLCGMVTIVYGTEEIQIICVFHFN
jgi:hypothetical protein